MTTTTQPDFPALIRKAGWEPETSRTEADDGTDEGTVIDIYRAYQGPFSTPWMASWQEVWNYIKAKK